MEEYDTAGRHIMADLYGVKSEILNNAIALENILKAAAEHCGATVLKGDAWEFDPQGVTAYFILSESHISIHTYPERGFCAIDCYTCGPNADPEVAMKIVVDILQPRKCHIMGVSRGNGEDWDILPLTGYLT